ncbi:hypothetical protein LCGC14_1579870, partial [marine sediment metagenome]
NGTYKSFTRDDIFATVRMIQAAGINVIGNFIFGLPDDTLESMRATLDMVMELNCEFANFYSAMAYPGSKLFSEADPKDLPDNWSGYSQHSYDCKPLPTETLSSAEVLSFRDKAFEQYFINTDYLEMIERKFGLDARVDLTNMTMLPLPRQFQLAS